MASSLEAVAASLAVESSDALILRQDPTETVVAPPPTVSIASSASELLGQRLLAATEQQALSPVPEALPLRPMSCLESLLRTHRRQVRIAFLLSFAHAVSHGFTEAATFQEMLQVLFSYTINSPIALTAVAALSTVDDWALEYWEAKDSMLHAYEHLCQTQHAIKQEMVARAHYWNVMIAGAMGHGLVGLISLSASYQYALWTWIVNGLVTPISMLQGLTVEGSNFIKSLMHIGGVWLLNPQFPMMLRLLAAASSLAIGGLTAADTYRFAQYGLRTTLPLWGLFASYVIYSLHAQYQLRHTEFFRRRNAWLSLLCLGACIGAFILGGFELRALLIITTTLFGLIAGSVLDATLYGTEFVEAASGHNHEGHHGHGDTMLSLREAARHAPLSLVMGMSGRILDTSMVFAGLQDLISLIIQESTNDPSAVFKPTWWALTPMIALSIFRGLQGYITQTRRLFGIFVPKEMAFWRWLHGRILLEIRGLPQEARLLVADNSLPAYGAISTPTSTAVTVAANGNAASTTEETSDDATASYWLLCLRDAPWFKLMLSWGLSAGTNFLVETQCSDIIPSPSHRQALACGTSYLSFQLFYWLTRRTHQACRRAQRGFADRVTSPTTAKEAVSATIMQLATTALATSTAYWGTPSVPLLAALTPFWSTAKNTVYAVAEQAGTLKRWLGCNSRG